MFKLHRGKVIYVPLVVPENIFLGLAHLCSLVSCILLFVAATSHSWHVMLIDVEPLSAFDVGVRAKLSFGLRSFHVSYCEGLKCTFEDMYYSSCSDLSTWCVAHADLVFSFALLVCTGIGLLLSSLAALSKAAVLPTGHFLCAWGCILAILSYRQRRHSFVPSDVLAAWIDGGNPVVEQADGYYCATAAVGVIVFGVVLATVGYHRLAMSTRQEEPSAEQARQPGRAEAPVAHRARGER